MRVIHAVGIRETHNSQSRSLGEGLSDLLVLSTSFPEISIISGYM